MNSFSLWESQNILIAVKMTHFGYVRNLSRFTYTVCPTLQQSLPRFLEAYAMKDEPWARKFYKYAYVWYKSQ